MYLWSDWFSIALLGHDEEKVIDGEHGRIGPSTKGSVHHSPLHIVTVLNRYGALRLEIRCRPRNK